MFGAVFNASAGAVTVDLDQRIRSYDTADICLLNSAGDEVANPNPVSVSIPTQGAGPEAVVLQFVGGLTGPVAEASMLSIGCNTTSLGTPYTPAFSTPLTSDESSADAESVAQIVAPVGAAARLHAVHVKAHKAHKSKKARRSKKA